MKRFSKSISIMLAVITILVSTMTGFTVLADENAKLERISDVVFVIDDTKSMKTNDKKKLTAVAVDKYINNIPKTADKAGGVGIVTFANKVLKKKAITYVGSNKSGKEVVKFINSNINQNGNCTNCAKGIREAVTMLSTSKNDSKAIILVTDGEYDFDGTDASKKQQLTSAQKLLKEQVKKAKDSGIKIYTIKIESTGKTAKVGEVPFKYITDETGGKHYNVKNANAVNSSVKDITHILWKINPIVDEEFEIYGTYEKLVNFPKGVVYANFQIDHNDPLEVVSFKYKDGKEVYNVVTEENTYMNIRVDSPEEGEATLTLRSKKKQKVNFSYVLYQDMSAKATINDTESATITTKEVANVQATVFDKDKENTNSQGSIILSAIIKDQSGNSVVDPVSMSYVQGGKYSAEINGKNLTPGTYDVEVELYNTSGEKITKSNSVQLVVEKAPVPVLAIVLGVLGGLLLLALIVLLVVKFAIPHPPKPFGPIRYDYISDTDSRMYQMDRLEGKCDKSGAVHIGQLVRANGVPVLDEVVFTAIGTKKMPVLQIENRNNSNDVSVTVGTGIMDTTSVYPGVPKAVKIGDQINIEVAEHNIKITIYRQS